MDQNQDFSDHWPRTADVDKAQEVFEEIDPYWAGYLDIREPLEIWNYIIFTTPVILFVLTCQWVGFPIVLHFLHWLPKLLWPRLLGFPLLHELIRSLEYITDPRLPSIGDLIIHAEGILKHVLLLDERDEK